MLEIVKDANNTLRKANDAEIKIVDNMRKLGATLLREWANYQENKMKDEWTKENIISKKHGKKKSIGKLPLGE